MNSTLRHIIGIIRIKKANFGTQVYPMGSIALVSPSVVCPSVFQYLKEGSLVFSETLHDVSGSKKYESDTAVILKNKS